MLSKRQLAEWVTRVILGSLISAASIHSVAAASATRVFPGN